MNRLASPVRHTPAKETILTNAMLVLPDVVMHGSVVLRDGVIAELQPGRSDAPAAIDLDGDYLIPGVVDLHTDNLERQVLPRPTARWPSRSAMIAHDAQCAAAGVTTVFDSLCLGELSFDKERVRTCEDAVTDLDHLAGTGLLKSEHLLHLRCELPAPDMLERLDRMAEHPLTRLVSLMDHSPGVGQYSDLDLYRALRRKEGLTETEIDQSMLKLQGQRERLRDPNRQALLARVAGLLVVLASHDDRTEAEVAQNYADGIRISEFPVTMAAAVAAKACGMAVIAGSPNLIRGGSHSGNVAAADLVREGAINAFASDYVPASLVEAAFFCVARGWLNLPDAVALITGNPAGMAGLTDRGRLAPEARADLVRVRLHEGSVLVREVWRAGQRVA
jgi:alpha-D-ribose 1-methylphosphonate 5-triphosphate diphosphatase